MDNILAAGTTAPEFSLPVTPDQKLALSELRGRPVILAFYPADWSPRWRLGVAQAQACRSGARPLGPGCPRGENQILQDLLDLVLEDWAIWLRWESAFRRGEVDKNSHPSLPRERVRHEQIQALIGDRLEAKRNGPIRQLGTLKIGHGEWLVRWRDAPSRS